jgi:diguanylate cyclase (GGDEF)-like protein/PAS domain S-box-containing protein
MVGPGTIRRILWNYACFGAAWIGSSDVLVFLHGGETWQNAGISLLKGLLFVTASAALLNILIANLVRDTVNERDTFRERLRNWNLDANDIVLLLDDRGRILEVNDRAIAAYGYTFDQLTQKNVADLVGDDAGLADRLAEILRNGSLRSEAVHRRADSTTFPVEFSARRFDVGGETFIHSIIRDISTRQEAERQLLNLKDIYAALFQTNQCIAHSSNRDQLFQQTCNIAVHRAHLKLAWIGTIDLTSDNVVPIAMAGQAVDYVQGLQVSTNAESPWSKGVAGQALRSGFPLVENNLWKSGRCQPWAERLAAFGIEAWAAFPIFQGGQAMGVLTLYSDESHFFTRELTELLGEMANELSLALDRMELRSKQGQLESELDKLKKAVEQSPVTVVIADRTGAIQYVNPAFTATSGYSAEDAIGKNPRFLKSGETCTEDYSAMWRRLSDGQAWAGRFHNKRKDGTLYWEEAVISPVKDSSGAITHFIAVKQDVTARREAETQARFLAFHDSLTELPNRMVAESKMSAAIRAAGHSGRKAALLFIDVDNFKRVNDSFGHGTGDRLLKEIVGRLASCMRESDTLARVSGDEFLVVAPDIGNPEVVESIAERIRKSFEPALVVDGREISTTVSIGAAVYPDDGTGFEELHRQADLAMYSAKRGGRNTFRAYTESMEAGAHDYIMTVTGLRRALERGEFILEYQPQINLETGQVQAVEALIRWYHPERGLISPGQFIPIAEESGLIVEIGNWVIREACRQAAEWRDKGISNLRVATNVSAIQIQRGGLDHVIASALKESHLEPASFEIELTESALIYDKTDVAALLRLLKGFGIGISLDDFGTGYSNFTYLRNFTLDRLKIDQSFIRNITSSAGDVAIVKSIVQLARNFGLETVAEGVETDESLRVVRRAGCHCVQGYLLARPMPAEDIPTFIANSANRIVGTIIASPKCRYFPPNVVQ